MGCGVTRGVLLGPYIYWVAPGPNPGGNINPRGHILDMVFRLSAKAVFLTYPQCALSPNVVHQKLSELKPTRYINVVKELHEDGAPHLHVLIQFVDKANIRNERFFDIEGFHPNVQSARDVEAVRDYIEKSLLPDTLDECQYKSGTLVTQRKESLWEAVADATTVEEIMGNARKASARDYVLQHDRLVEYARSRAQAPDNYVPPPGELFALPPALTEWMIREFTNPVGLLPHSFYKERHVLKSDKSRIVLEPWCSSGRHELEKLNGHVPSDIIFTGGECPICHASDQKLNT